MLGYALKSTQWDSGEAIAVGCWGGLDMTIDNSAAGLSMLNFVFVSVSCGGTAIKDQMIYVDGVYLN